MSSASSNPLAAALGPIGIWCGALRRVDPGEAREAAVEIEELGFGAIWISGGSGGDLMGDVDRLLAATRRVVIATGVLNIWKHEPAEVGAWWRGLAPEHRQRVLLGLGVSHGPSIGADYRRPLAKMSAYLDALDAEGVEAERRCLAALGPKMLDLARERTAGSHPYLTTPEHTAMARERLGPGALLAPEQGVIMETDPAAARAMGATGLALYMQLPNYVNNWRRLGFDEADVTQPSERLLDAIYSWGGAGPAAERARAHLAAGADHVCLQVIRGGPMDPPELDQQRAAWRSLAKALL